MLIVLFFSLFKLKIESKYYNDDMQEVICITFLLIDIIRTFYTGIYREAYTDTILSRRKVAKYKYYIMIIID